MVAPQALLTTSRRRPQILFNLALDQLGGDATVRAIEDILGVVVTKNEAAWIKELRDASGKPTRA